MRCLLASVLMVALAGCQCFAPITVSGSLETGILFRASESAGSYVGGDTLLNLTVFAVGDRDTRPLWQLRGRARPEALVYGAVPAGMSEDAPAVRLERGKTYLVVVEGSPGNVLPGPTCRGRMRFTVGPDGAITSCYEEGSACG